MNIVMGISTIVLVDRKKFLSCTVYHSFCIIRR